MMRTTLTRRGAWLKAAVLGFALQSVACTDFEGLEGERSVSTHVTDWRDEVVYQLLTDRFGNGDVGNDYRVDLGAPARYHGGDWRGVEDNLDYLSDLGVTALWISPIIKNVETDAGVDGYHGYWAQDLTQLNPHFGNLLSLRRMVDAAHAKGIKVILDIVTNHLGQVFYYDINLNGQPDERVETNKPGEPVTFINEYDPDYDPRGVQAFTSLGEAGPAPIYFQYDPATNHLPPNPKIFQKAKAYNRRGKVYDFDQRDQTEKGDFPGGLKDINTLDKDVQKAMVDVFVRWVELTDLDGFRIDTLKHVEHEFWQVFAPAVRSRLAKMGKKNFFMFGEAFDGNDELVGSYTFDNEVDSVFYFPQHFTVYRDVFQNGMGTDRIQQLFSQRADDTGNYGTKAHPGGIGIAPNKALVNFIDNHDVARFRFYRKQPEALENALLFLFAEDGIPCLYYGTEQGFAGGNDPANREDLWRTGYDRSNRYFKWVKKLTAIRKNYRALTHGDLTFTWSSDRTGDEEDAGIVAFERAGGDADGGYALVVINTNADHSSKASFEGNAMMTTASPGSTLVDVLTGDKHTVGGGGELPIEVPATSGVILVPEKDAKTF